MKFYTTFHSTITFIHLAEHILMKYNVLFLHLLSTNQRFSQENVHLRLFGRHGIVHVSVLFRRTHTENWSTFIKTHGHGE